MTDRIHITSRRAVAGAFYVALAMAITACGGDGPGGDRTTGGGGDGGGGDQPSAPANQPSAPADQQAQIAALQGIDLAELAEQPPGEGDTETPPATGDGDAPARAAQTAEAEDRCENLGGTGYFEVNDNKSYQLQDTDFGSEFSNVPSGSVSGSRIMADCEGQDVTIKGQLDTASQEQPSGGDLVYYRAGDIDDGADEPNVDELYRQQLSIESFQTEFSTRGVLYHCAGCVDGDLGNFSGDPQLDGRLAAFLVMNFDSLHLEMGSDENELFVFDRSDAGGGRMNLSLDGRMAFQDQREGFEDCDFDVTYTTDRDLLVDNVGTAEEQISSGEVTLTVNDGGPSYNVEYNDGNVIVDGDPVDESDIADVCPQD